MSDAGKCRANGWGVGDVLEGFEFGRGDRIRLTAIGEDNILARTVASKVRGGEWAAAEGYETLWTLDCREWKKVGPNTEASTP
jgi:hypothetical protein